MSQVKIFSKENEQAILGALIIAPETRPQLNISADEFYLDRHKMIFRAIDKSIATVGVLETNYLTIQTVLEDSGELDTVGGPAYLTTLANSTPTSLFASGHADIVRNKAEQRKHFQTGQDIMLSAMNGGVDVSAIVQQLVGNMTVVSTTSKIGDMLDDYSDWLDDRIANPVKFIGHQTPWGEFNRVLGGSEPGLSYVIMGDKDVGKTVMLIQLAAHWASKGLHVDVYELEMTAERLLQRVVAIESGVSTKKQIKGEMTQIERDNIDRALKRISSWPLFIDDSTHWTSMAIRADMTRKKIRRKNADIVMVDYLALLKDRPELKEHERQEIAAKNLRDMGKDLKIAVWQVASVTHAGTMRGSKEIQYAQDKIFLIQKDNTDSRVRLITPDKMRDGLALDTENTGNPTVRLVFAAGLPKLGEVAHGR